MDIRIKHISIINFKGIRNFEADFGSSATEFRGDNATGKTSLFDAFTWCLYGKDSSGRSDSNFKLKTLDENNDVIYRLPHEVEVTLLVDGSEVKLRKSYNEVWKKKRGSKEETFSGHTIDRYWNDVPMSDAEFKMKIDSICSEEVFKMITNPTHFLSLPKKEQRAFLTKMAGEVTMEDIVAEYPKFAQLVADMNGKTMEEYYREIASKINRIKAETATLPARIDEVQRSLPEDQDWETIEAQIADKENTVAGIDGQMQSASAAYEEANKARQALYKQKSDLTLQVSERTTRLRQAALTGYYSRKQEYDRLTAERSHLSIDGKRLSMVDDLKAKIDYCSDKRTLLLADWHSIKAMAFQAPDESNFVCPTCHRPLDMEEINAKIAEMERNYNAETARLLEANKVDGIANNEDKAEAEKRLQELELAIEADKKRITEIDRLLADFGDMTMPQVSVDSDEQIAAWKAEIAKIQADIDADNLKAPDLSQLKAQREAIKKEIADLNAELLKRNQIGYGKTRIEELSTQLRKQQDEIARLEGIQFNIDSMKHALMDKVENTVNSMFTMVRFKMYEQQINGGEAETCEALVNGVPYSTNLNTAARINAGIDIINAISRHSGVHAPIWIDNRESITTLIDTDSQVINLVKDENYKLLTLVTF